MQRAAAALRVLGALLFLHLGLAMFYWLPEPSVANVFAPSWDLLGFIGLVVAWRALGDAPWVRSRLGRLGGGSDQPRAAAPRRMRSVRGLEKGFAIGLVAVTSIFFVLGFGQGFARREFGWDLVLPLHIPYVPELFRMMYDHEPLGMFVLFVALLVIGIVAAVVGVCASFCALRSASRTRRGRRALAGGVAAYALVVGLVHGVHPSLAPEALSQIRYTVKLDAALQATARSMERESGSNIPANPFAGMQDKPSIYTFVIESYGVSVFEDELLAERAEPFLRERSERLDRAGYSVRTGLLDAPVFGGSSWMANASLLCGVRIDNQERFESLFESHIACLPALLNDAGYRTAVAAANTTFQEERNVRMFPFDAYYYRDDFGYQGMRYGWGFVPDQYVVHFVDQREVEPRAGEARFIHYQLTTSHHPWSEIPPYIEDWESIGDGSRVLSAPGKSYENQFVRGREYKQGYWETVEYSMRVILDYIETLPDEDAIIFVLGDHQPRSPIAEMHEDSWAVPVHVFARDAAAVERFAELGYASGMAPPPVGEPARDAPDGFEHFIRHLFEAYAEDHESSTRTR